jgi:hypothetical protein
LAARFALRARNRSRLIANASRSGALASHSACMMAFENSMTRLTPRLDRRPGQLEFDILQVGVEDAHLPRDIEAHGHPKTKAPGGLIARSKPLISRTLARMALCKSTLSRVQTPCWKLPFRSPRGPPEPLAPPCIRHRARPVTAACLQLDGVTTIYVDVVFGHLASQPMAREHLPPLGLPLARPRGSGRGSSTATCG